MMTLEEIKNFAKGNAACIGQYYAFDTALKNGNTIMAWQIVLKNKEWLENRGCMIDTTDIPKEVNNNCIIYDFYDNISELFFLKDYMLSGLHEIFYSNGQLRSCDRYKKGLKCGKCISYFTNGKIDNIYLYKNGLVNGISKSYFDDGMLWAITPHKNGTIEGIRKTYFNNRKIRYRASFVGGVLHGEYIEYFKNGKINTIGNYIKNNLDGDYIKYDSDGGIIEHLIYKNDVMVQRLI